MLRQSAFLAAFAAVPLMAQDPAAGSNVQFPGVRKATFGGQYRLRYEGLFDYDRDSDAGANTDYWGQRARFDVTLDVADSLDAFIQLQDARNWGEETSPTDDSADGFDLHQGYVDFTQSCFGGSTRVGRSEVNLGDQRLVGALDWSTGARSLDGILQNWDLGNGASLLAFAFQTNEALTSPETNDDAQLAGLYYTNDFSESAHGEFYLLHLHADDGAAAIGSTNVTTLGTRWDITANDQLSFNGEAAYQTGDAGNGVDVKDAYAIAVSGQWAFGGDNNPTVAVGFDMGTGDDPTTPDNERFNNLLPTAHKHWGMMDLATWANTMSPWARFAMDLDAGSNASITFYNFTAQEEGDMFGGPNGTLTTGGTDDAIGNEIDLLYTRNIDWAGPAKASIQLGLGLFLPGDGAKSATGKDDMAEFFYAQFNLDF